MPMPLIEEAGGAKAALEPMRIERYGEYSLRLTFGDGISPDIARRVRQCDACLRQRRLPWVRDIIPAYAGCLVLVDDSDTSLDEAASMLKDLDNAMVRVELPETGHHEIPVRYGGDDGPDLDAVSGQTGLAIPDVIALHASALYTVFAIGFLPGFPYLGILDERLFLPRLDTPRLRIPAGSVGIARDQTGIFPMASPSGWHILGRTKACLFDPGRPPHAVFRLGDTVRFVPR